MAENAIKGTNDSDNIVQLMAGQETGDSQQLAIMEAIALSRVSDLVIICILLIGRNKRNIVTLTLLSNYLTAAHRAIKCVI